MDRNTVEVDVNPCPYCGHVPALILDCTLPEGRGWTVGCMNKKCHVRPSASHRSPKIAARRFNSAAFYLRSYTLRWSDKPL